MAEKPKARKKVRWVRGATVGGLKRDNPEVDYAGRQRKIQEYPESGRILRFIMNTPDAGLAVDHPISVELG